jgi:hypothetical protein
LNTKYDHQLCYSTRLMLYSFLLILPRSCRFIAHRHTSFRRAQMMALHSVAKEEQSTESVTALISGDFAGLTATFSPTGSLIPVPEQFIPTSLLKWGQEPSCLEVIVSETMSEGMIERQTATVYPAVGCDVDNLATSKTTHSIQWTEKASSDTAIAMDYGLNNEKTRTETIFALPNNHRLRIILDLVERQIQSPIQVYLERRTLTEFTKVAMADSGVLDGRTVFKLLGEELNSGKKFSDEKVEQMDDGEVRLPRGLSFALDGCSLIIQHENQKIKRIYKENGSVAIEV